MDPRLNIIDKRLENIKRLIAVGGGKGGIGKSLTASALALTLSKLGYKVGLLDLDFCSPSAHIILGVKGIYPKEEKGIIPPEIYGIRFMSIIYYAEDNPSPLRGIDISNAIIELLAITQWGELDFLIVDMPPGIGDSILDTIRLMKRVEFLIITTQSKVVLETVKKVLKILRELKVPIIGVIENMRLAKSSFVKEELKEFNVPFLSAIDFDKSLEDSLGDINKLSKTDFVRHIEKLVDKIK
ncbi:P-loop NTPase [candidate division WOR-3 bacterium]|nr:P-loop NTPase [candidate division WOR-3 bacterium]